MTSLADFFTLLSAVFVAVGAIFAFVGSLGLVRLRSFYDRIHAPTLGTTLATVLMCIAGLIEFSMLGAAPAVNVLLLLLFVTLSTPISLIVLVRASVLRDRIQIS